MAGKKSAKKAKADEEIQDESVETTVATPEEEDTETEEGEVTGQWPGEPWHTR